MFGPVVTDTLCARAAEVDKNQVKIRATTAQKFPLPAGENLAVDTTTPNLEMIFPVIHQPRRAASSASNVNGAGAAKAEFLETSGAISSLRARSISAFTPE